MSVVRSNSPEPLRLDLPPLPPRGGKTTVEETWGLIQARMEGAGSNYTEIDRARAGFVAGVYAAAKDVLMLNVGSQDLSEAADRIERRR